MPSAECWLKTQAVSRTFQPNEGTYNANVVIGKRKYPVINTKELSCNNSNYIEINKKLDCFGSGEPHNDDTNSVILSDRERSHKRGDFTNFAILRCTQNDETKPVIVSESETIQSIVNQNQLQGNKYTFHEKNFSHFPFHFLQKFMNCECCRLMRGEVRKTSRKVAFTLAEGATHVAHWENSRKIAFTLAEVLITLGIIGVVAALTLPTVITNYQKHVTVTKLEKAYTTLSQAFKLSEANNDSSEHWDNAFEIGADNYFNKYWKPYLNGAEVCKKYQDCGYNSNTPFYTLKGQVDGVTVGDSSHSRILFRINSDTVYLLFASMGTASITGSQPSNHIWIDINGGKGPNMFGKDVFQFRYVTGDGIVPSGIDYPNYVRTSCSRNQGKGDYCAAKIIQDGWKIADDYPW